MEVTITYNEQARVEVTAKDVTSGKQAQTVIVRQENVVAKPASAKSAPPAAEEDAQAEWVSPSLKASSAVTAKPGAPAAQPAAKAPASAPKPASAPQKTAVAPASSPKPVSAPKLAQPQAKSQTSAGPKSALSGPRLEESNQPIPLCNECGEALNFKGICPACGWNAAAKKPIIGAKPPVKTAPIAPKPAAPKPPAAPTRQLAPPAKPTATRPKSSDDDDLMEMALSSMNKPGTAKPPLKKPPVKKGEDEFWKDEK